MRGQACEACGLLGPEAAELGQEGDEAAGGDGADAGHARDLVQDFGGALGPRDGGAPREARVLAVDTIVVCAGQESVRDLYDGLDHPSVHLVGGADLATELDAKRAIRQGTEVAAAL